MAATNGGGSAFPEPPILDAGDVPSLGWAVLGPGGIAGAFVTALREHSTQRLVSVGSSSRERAEAFATTHGAGAAFGDYGAAIETPGVDVVYVAAQNPAHVRLALLAIERGRHVLVEKPLAITAADGRRLRDAARAAGVLLAEAMWTRFLPQAGVMRALLQDGALGDVVFAEAHHGFAPPPGHRVFDPTAGGGALLDVGVYSVSFVRAALGAPTRLVVDGLVHPSGVDAQAVLTLSHGDGATSVATCSLLAKTWNRASIAGTRAVLAFEDPFFAPTALTLTPAREGAAALRWADPTGIRGSGGLVHQALAIADDIGRGRRDSLVHPIEDAIATLDLLDEARDALGVRFPEDDAAAARPGAGQRSSQPK